MACTLNNIQVHASFPTPLVWNAERRWSFSVSLRQPTIYILRDHVNMFTDLTRDWTSGPPTGWNHFVPTIYVFELYLHQFELNLYANDQNIIDKPLVRGENSSWILLFSRRHPNALKFSVGNDPCAEFKH